MNVYEETKQIMNRYNIKADKSLGQNFLINDDVIEKIIDSADIQKEDLIIEIGPGLGVLTNRLLQKANNVIAIELDGRMVKVLENRFQSNIANQFSNKLEIINEDVLKLNLSEIIEQKRKQENINKVKVVANLPYYISTPIIIKLLENQKNINEIIVMVQKEVAERLTAKTGKRTAGAITYIVEYYAEAEEIVNVPKESFVPSPKVESEVIKLKTRTEPIIDVKDEELLFNLIQKAFSQRRKTLINALTNTNMIKNKNDGEHLLEEIGLRNDVRGEKLTLQQFGKLADNITNDKNVSQ